MNNKLKKYIATLQVDLLIEAPDKKSAQMFAGEAINGIYETEDFNVVSVWEIEDE